MGFLKDFKTFATKGNLADLAIAVVIGAAFTKVVNSFIDGCIMPLLGLIGTGDLATASSVLRDSTEVKDAAGKVLSSYPAITIKYGAFLSAIITFLIVALVCYMVIKVLLRKDPNAAPDPTPSEVLLAEIRDSLKK